MTAPDFTPEQAAKLAEFEAAAPAPESVVERATDALIEAWYPERSWIVSPEGREQFRDGVRAVLDVLRGPATEAEKAIERVLALADRHEACCQFIAVWDLRRAIEQP